MPRKWKPQKLPKKSSKEIDKIRAYTKEMDTVRDLVQEHIDQHLRDGKLNATIRGHVESLGAIVGRKNTYPFSIRFNIHGAVPLTIRELAEIDLNSNGWKTYGPLHKRGRIPCRIGIECSKHDAEIKTQQAYDRFLKWIKDNHIKLSIPGWNDFYVKDKSKSSDSWS